MYQYEYEKRRPVSVMSCESRATVTTDWSRIWPSTGGNPPATVSCLSSRPLPSLPVICSRIHDKPGVPVKVWLVATVTCFTICLILVAATIAITKWGITDSISTTGRFYADSKYTQRPIENNFHTETKSSNEIAKNASQNLLSQKQYRPEHDTKMEHNERKIEKKSEPKLMSKLKTVKIPDFKPTLPELFTNKRFDLEYDYYGDENFYEDYIQSTSLTSYLLEKLQEIHDWFVEKNSTVKTEPNSPKQDGGNDDFTELLQAINTSIVEGNVTIIMYKLKNIFFNDKSYDNVTEKKIVLTNRTDLLSFGIMTLDIMLLHNIQIMAWESQESLKSKMLKDPDVFAFNALFMDPIKVKQNELSSDFNNTGKRVRADQLDNVAIGKNVIENIMEFGMNTARAVIHLGRTYKNTKSVINQLSNRDQLQANIQQQLGKNVMPNTHALKHLQSSYVKNDSSISVANVNNTFFTELDCVWLLYCRNLVATSKLSRPYGVMARINGVALRMLSGDLSPDKAIDTFLYEAMTGWTDLKCNELLPRCSKADAAKIILDSILQPAKKNYN